MKYGYGRKRGDFQDFFKTSLDLFRKVKKKHDDELRAKLESFFMSEEYCKAQLKKLVQLEKEKILRNTQYK